MARRKRRVPEVLWRAYGTRARSLSETVLSILPSAHCRCSGFGCLGCRGASFLLRTDDGPEYRKLLNRSFCVIAEDAPRSDYLTFDNHLDQNKVVGMTTALMLANSLKPENVLCYHYNEIGDQIMYFLLKFSSIFVPLSNKLHHQVAGPPLNQILQGINRGGNIRRWTEKKNKKGKNIEQNDLRNGKSLAHSLGAYVTEVAGCLVHDKNVRHAVGETRVLCKLSKSFGINIHEHRDSSRQGESTKHVLEEANSLASADYSSGHTENFVVDNIFLDESIEVNLDERINFDIDLGIHSSGMKVYSSRELRPSVRKRMGSFNQMQCRKKMRLNSQWQDMLGKDVDRCNFFGKNSQERLPSHYNQPPEKCTTDSGDLSQFRYFNKGFNKIKRLSGRKNSAKHRKMDIIRRNFLGNHLEKGDSLDSSYKIKPVNSCFQSTEQATSKCFHCLVVQAASRVSHKEDINRRCMFYNSGKSCSAFPKNHLLNRLKPNTSGALVLLKHIFGISEELPGALELPCSSSRGVCIKQGCLYHSLLSMLKVMIQNVQHCQYLKLLHKHCLDPLSVRHFDNDHNLAKYLHRCIGRVEHQLLQLQLSEQVENVFKTEFRNRNSLVGHGSYCSHHEVVSFLWAVCRSTIPVDLLGNVCTWRSLRRNISKFIRLRRFEKFTVEQCLHGLKTSGYPTISRISQCPCAKANSKAEHYKYSSFQISARNMLFTRWIYWFFSYMILPVVSGHFYVTEKEAGRQAVFYFPKPLWCQLVDKAISSLKQETYTEINQETVENIVRRRSFGFSKVRFLPKEKDLRPLLNLKAPSKLCLPIKETSSKMSSNKKGRSSEANKKFVNANSRGHVACFRPVNSVLYDMAAIFKAIKAEHSEYLGASVFGYNDVYRILCPFMSGLKNGDGTMQKVFIIVSDVSKAFDSIDQNMLLCIMKDIMHKEEYHLRRHAQVISTKKSILSMYGPVCRLKGNMSTKEAAASICSSNGILVDQGTSRTLKQNGLHRLLEEHVKRNIIQLSDGYFLQKVGIPQGSLLSSLLCSFYYGHMERYAIFPFLRKICKLSCPHENTGKLNDGDRESMTNRINTMYSQFRGAKYHISSTIGTKDLHCGPIGTNAPSSDVHKDTIMSDGLLFPDSVLMRWVDDFLLISTCEKVANGFLDRLQRGFHRYNCFMNREKFAVNFEAGKHSEPLVSKVYTGSDGESFIPWSGLLFNCKTLEIQADYTRYWNVHMNSTLTVLPHDKPGHHLKVKLCGYMRPKCHPIFYDLNINSMQVVALNAYQAFVICAMKFHCYFCALSLSGISLSPRYCADVIQGSFRYTYKLIKTCTYAMECDGKNRPIFRLKKEEILCLGLSAYIHVLQKKQSRYLELLSLLNTELVAFESVSSSSHIKFAIDDSHSSLIWKIRY